MPADPLTPEYENAIRERAQAATPGPWEQYLEYGDDFYAFLGGSHLRGVGNLNFGDGEDAAADRAFTLHARTDVPALLAELDRVRAELANAIEHRDHWHAELMCADARIAELGHLTRHGDDTGRRYRLNTPKDNA
ncbi:hypothetical protein [Streptomyces sp. NBC_01506]|uniref:hypothetical protein n=1 Tax=Streptomyces sp. NBC_01506 TaxID=2903887 RepID=UPI003870609E